MAQEVQRMRTDVLPLPTTPTAVVAAPAVTAGSCACCLPTAGTRRGLRHSRCDHRQMHRSEGRQRTGRRRRHAAPRRTSGTAPRPSLADPLQEYRQVGGIQRVVWSWLTGRLHVGNLLMNRLHAHRAHHLPLLAHRRPPTPPSFSRACFVELADEGVQAGHLQGDTIGHVLHLPHFQHGVTLGLAAGRGR